MQLGETIATYDVALALRGESGKFEVTNPTGEIYQVTCRPNHSIPNLEWSGNQSSRQPFLIRKVSEPVVIEPGRTAPLPVSDSNATSTRAPFLLESPEEAGKQPVKTPEEIWTFQLSYLTAEAGGKQPARICVKPERSEGSDKPESRWVTAACSSFNDLDVEIRKLHAQLEAIQVEAKKTFYKAQAASA